IPASPTGPQGRLCRQIPAELHCKGFRSAITGKLGSLPSHGRRAERRSRKETWAICRFGAEKGPPPPTGYESRVDEIIAFEADIRRLATRPHHWCGTWRSGLARVGRVVKRSDPPRISQTVTRTDGQEVGIARGGGRRHDCPGGRTRNKAAARRRPRHPSARGRAVRSYDLVGSTHYQDCSWNLLG